MLIFGFIFLFFSFLYKFLIVNCVHVFFHISHFIGHILVNKFLILLKFIFESSSLIYAFLQVLFEDSLIFAKDAAEIFIYVIHLLKYVWLRVEELGWICVRGLCGVEQVLNGAVGTLSNAAASVRFAVHVAGSSVWKFLTLLPETVLHKINAISAVTDNTLKDLTFAICKFFSNVLEVVGKIYLFFFDIPLNSVYGLTISAILALIVYIKFRDICNIISSSSVKLCRRLTNFGNTLWTGRFLERRTRANHDDESLCVVCQYHPREMIIFPCKHLCLCADCSLQLTKIRPNCPVCRGGMEKTIKVYL